MWLPRRQRLSSKKIRQFYHLFICLSKVSGLHPIFTGNVCPLAYPPPVVIYIVFEHLGRLCLSCAPKYCVNIKSIMRSDEEVKISSGDLGISVPWFIHRMWPTDASSVSSGVQSMPSKKLRSGCGTFIFWI